MGKVGLNPTNTKHASLPHLFPDKRSKPVSGNFPSNSITRSIVMIYKIFMIQYFLSPSDDQSPCVGFLMENEIYSNK